MLGDFFDPEPRILIILYLRQVVGPRDPHGALPRLVALQQVVVGRLVQLAEVTLRLSATNLAQHLPFCLL